ncbi:hypothetical protein BC941DRAFT_472738 [Chlamydoabsidia padenii]|nr:hypothetical protein BC941DRAFT_472738 [Chlamydoabsidia padenii]
MARPTVTIISATRPSYLWTGKYTRDTANGKSGASKSRCQAMILPDAKTTLNDIVVCLTVDTVDEVIELMNKNSYGNGIVILTNSGAAARTYEHKVDMGQVEINIQVLALQKVVARC